jgi:AraC-like DNA-binding protein
MKMEGESSVRRYLHAYALNLEEILTLKSQLPEMIARDWYEHFHRSLLVYFLGEKEDGSINYDLPEGLSWDGLEGLDLFPRIKEAMAERFSSPQEASRHLGLTFLSKEYQLRGILKGRLREETMAQMANGLGLSRRLLFFYFRQEELRRMLGADTALP